jgi:hypothetical protein
MLSRLFPPDDVALVITETFAALSLLGWVIAVVLLCWIFAQ